MVEVMKIMVTSFRKSHAHTATLTDPNPYSRPPPTQASARDSWTLTGKSGSVSCWVTAAFSHIPQLSDHMPQLIVCRPQLKIPHAARKVKNPVYHN